MGGEVDFIERLQLGFHSKWGRFSLNEKVVLIGGGSLYYTFLLVIVELGSKGE